MRNGHFITDYHCHSTVSPDGHNTMREMAEAAVRLGVDDLCFTDHIEPLPWDRWNEPPREKHSYDWAPMLAQFREAQEAVGGRIKLHMGAELGECSFAPDVADSFLDDAPPLDFTIGSVHCYRTASGEVNDLTWITSTDPAVWYAACESYFEEMEKLIDWGRFQVLGHITLPLRWAKELRGVELDFDRYEEQLRHVMRRAIEKGLGIECNTNRGPHAGVHLLRDGGAAGAAQGLWPALLCDLRPEKAHFPQNLTIGERTMKISLGCDHGGYALKEHIKAYLESKGHEVVDCGTYSTDSCDYPIFGEAAARKVQSGECERGIVICTTGIGISIAANKVRGIRCALCSEPLSAEMTRRHNNANMLAMGAGMIGKNMAERIVEVFLSTEFEGGRHERRVGLLDAIEG